MRILIRADASEQIGTGHLMRCLALSRALRERGANVTFACAPLPPAIARLLHAAGCGTLDAALSSVAPASRALPPAAQCADAAAVREALGAARFDWIVVDHYGLDACWEQEMRQSAERILAIDDLANRPHACDLLLDQNQGQDREARYRALSGSTLRCLIGPRYALLRPEFAAARGHSGPRRGPIERILVMYGGSDPTGETAKALDALRCVPDIGSTIDVVVGGANPRTRELAAGCARDARMLFHDSVTDVARLMAHADIALGACGTTAWERCAVYLPAIAIVVAENQREIAAALASAGAAEIAGWHASVSANGLADTLARLAAEPARVRALSRHAGDLVDGLGVQRVIAAMEEVHANSRVLH
jgi:UDP-2,4-diacetamido-2,4,6-trideoxy-beta-L-altropyranose hydrolase